MHVFLSRKSVYICVCVSLCVLLSVCVSVWSVAEGGVSSNLGQSRDGKVNSAVKHRERHTYTHAQYRQTSTHIDTLKSKHTKEDIYGKHDSCEKVKIHTGDFQVYATYLCVYGGARMCVCVCVCVCVSVLAGAMVEAMRVSLSAFLEPCDIPHGRQKDNVTVKRGARGKQRRERMEKEESQESWVWISLKCSIWWVIIFTKAAKSILYPKGVAPTHSFLPVLPHSFLWECQLVSIICLFFWVLFRTWSSRNVYDLLRLPQTFQCVPHK